MFLHLFFVAKTKLNHRGGLKQRWAVKLLAGYVAFGWLLMEILYFGVWCQPFDQYWAVPVANSEYFPRIENTVD
jgi:hypothetical protein